jgi:hypothetical protein
MFEGYFLTATCLGCFSDSSFSLSLLLPLIRMNTLASSTSAAAASSSSSSSLTPPFALAQYENLVLSASNLVTQGAKSPFTISNVNPMSYLLTTPHGLKELHRSFYYDNDGNVYVKVAELRTMTKQPSLGKPEALVNFPAQFSKQPTTKGVRPQGYQTPPRTNTPETPGTVVLTPVKTAPPARLVGIEPNPGPFELFNPAQLLNKRYQVDPKLRSLKVQLVGIELNPGPPTGLAGKIGKVGAALGVQLAKMQIASKKKKRKRDKKEKVVMKVFKSDVKTRSNPAPISNIRSTQFSHRNEIVRVPFKSAVVQVRSDNNGELYLTTTGTVSAATPPDSSLDLHPIGDRDTNGIHGHPFGPQVANLARAFNKWRLVEFKVAFQTALSTASTGLIAFGYAPDPGYNWDASIDYQYVTSCLRGCSGPFYANDRRMSFNATTSLPTKKANDWLNVAKADLSTAPQHAALDRQECDGTVMVTSPSLANPNIFCGVLQFTGVIEFYGIGTTASSGDISGPMPVIGSLNTINGSANTMQPFSANPLDKEVRLPIGVENNDSDTLGFGRDSGVSGDGIWRVRFTADNVNLSGPVTAPFQVASATPVGSATYALLSTSGSLSPPYSAQIVFAISGTTGQNATDYCDVTFMAMDTSIAQDTHLTIEKIG